jgi:predicted Zn-dependent peptidase
MIQFNRFLNRESGVARGFSGWFASALLAVVVLWAGVAGAQVTTGLESLEKQVKEFTLDNGLKFIVVERHEAPVFSFQTIVNAGSANDQIGTTGLAHMMEHMAFKGTEIVGTEDAKKEAKALVEEDKAWQALIAERRKGARADSTLLAELEEAYSAAQEEARGFVVSNEFSRILEENGVQGLNAFTALDFTGYLYSLPSNRLELWAVMEGSRMAHPVFREFYKEREVVYEERRMRVESSPFGRLATEFLQTAYVAHPYGFGFIGHPTDLQTFDRQEGEEFYRDYYVAPNMTVAVVGDVTEQDVKKYAEKYWNEIPDGPTPPAIDTEEPEQNAERRVVMPDPSQPMIFIAWHIPAVTDPTYPAYEALSSLLGGGDYARLQKVLVKDQKIAVQIQMLTGLPGNKYPSLIGALVIPATGTDPLEVEQAVYKVLDEIRTENPLTQEELDGYKVRARATMVSAAEDNMSLAGQLAINQIVFGDWREFFRSQERVLTLTLADLNAAMEKSIRRGNRTVGMIVSPEQFDGGNGGTE